MPLPSNPLLLPTSKSAWKEINRSTPQYDLLGGILENHKDLEGWADEFHVSDKKAFLEMFHRKRVAVIDLMTVSSELRGQGLGGKVLRQMERQAKKYGCWAIVLMAGGYKNRPGFDIVKWYEAKGFKKIDTADGFPLMVKWLPVPYAERTKPEGIQAGAAGERPESLSIQFDIMDAHRGELFGRVKAYLEKVVVGYVNFSEYDDEIWIKYVFVREDLRRRGIATAMYERIQQEFPGEPIRSTGTTDDGGKMRRSLVDRKVIASHKQTKHRENVYEDIGQGEGTEGYANQPEMVAGTKVGLPLDVLEGQMAIIAGYPVPKQHNFRTGQPVTMRAFHVTDRDGVIKWGDGGAFLSPEPGTEYGTHYIEATIKINNPLVVGDQIDAAEALLPEAQAK